LCRTEKRESGKEKEGEDRCLTQRNEKPSMVGVENMKRREKKEVEEVAKYKTKVTKEDVERLLSEGKSKDEIFQIYKDNYQGSERGLKVVIGRFAKSIEREKKDVKDMPIADKEAKTETKTKTKYYISTGYNNKEKAKQLARIIEIAGGEITFEWWKDEHNILEDTNELASIGEEELRGVRGADVVIVMMPGYLGTHTELGAALALGKKILLYSVGGFGVAMPFYYVSGVQQVVGSELDLAAELLEELV
jgi:hypothetical protein